MKITINLSYPLGVKTVEALTFCSSSSPSAAVFPDTARSASQSEQMRSMVHILHPRPFLLPESPFRNRQTGAW